MDPEQTFLRVHARLTGILARLMTRRFRTALEYLCLFKALVLLSLLVIMHVNFVGQPGCVKEFSKPGIAEAQLIQIKITNTWKQITHKMLSSNWWLSDKSGQFQAHDFPARGKLGFERFLMTNTTQKWWNGLIARFGPNQLGSNAGNIAENFRTKTEIEVRSSPVKLVDEALPYKPFGNLQFISRWIRDGAAHLKRPSKILRSFWQIMEVAVWEISTPTRKDERRAPTWIKPDNVDVGRRDMNSQLLDPTYLYSVEKGFLILSEDAKAKHNVQIVNVNISAQNGCFSNRCQQFLIDNFVGYDTVLMNSLLKVLGKGYMYNLQTKELYSLNNLQESKGALVGFQDYIALKFGVLIMSLFVFFTTTMSVSFTLRETQARMLRFTVQLQHHARHRLPTYRLIFVHIFESLVFVPIMIGILFFLFELFNDQLLAFMVLTLVWLCELFTMISIRTSISTTYFPLFFFLYFMIFHVYFFSYPYGFSYLAFSATAASMLHLILYFWNHFEIPALQHFSSRRALSHQQGLHIMSSATSDLELNSLNQSSAVIMGATHTLPQQENDIPNQDMTGTSTEESTVSQAQEGIVNRRSLPHNLLPLNVDNLNFRNSLNERSRNGQNDGNGSTLTHASYENQSNHHNNIVPDNVNVESYPGVDDLGENLLRSFDQLPRRNTQMSTGIPTVRTQPQPLALSSLLPWVLSSFFSTVFSLFPVSQDPSDRGSASSRLIEQEEQINAALTRWTSASNEGTGLRQRHGLITAESENR